MENKNIVSFVYSDLPSDTRVLRETNETAKSGANVVLIAPEPSKKVATSLNDSIELVYLPVSQQRGQTSISGHIRFMLAMRRWIKGNGQPDIVHIHNMPDYLYWMVRAWHKKGTRVVLDLHDIMSDLAEHRFTGIKKAVAVPILQQLERGVWKRVDHIITVNQDYADKLVAQGIPEGKVTIIPNVPDSGSCSISHRREPAQNCFKIVYHGVITERSGIRKVVQALPLVMDKIPDIRMTIVGDGEGSERLKEEIEKNGLGSIVTFVNQFLPFEQVLDHIADANVGVVPNEKSRYTEGILPVKLIEYCNLGIPTIATRLPMIEYYFGDNAVEFIESPQKQLLADSILKLYCDSPYRDSISKNGLEAAKKMAWENYAPKLIAAITGVEERSVEN